MINSSNSSNSNIIINGVPLTTSQKITVHVALQSFGMELQDNPDSLGDDEHGRFMTKSYLESIKEINKILVPHY
jgi:hypothetical protein